VKKKDQKTKRRRRIKAEEIMVTKQEVEEKVIV
jgi:hypothetical protein